MFTMQVQCHSSRASPVSSRGSNDSPGPNSSYRAIIELSGTRTPSIGQSCLTETTDCPSDVSVITSISAVPPNHHSSSSPSLRWDQAGGNRDTTGAHNNTSPSGSGQFRDNDHGRESQQQRAEVDLIQRVQDLVMSPSNNNVVATSRTVIPASSSRNVITGGGRSVIPAAQLRSLVRERLQQDEISLSEHPYTQSVRRRK